jgi:hypothetical protein
MTIILYHLEGYTRAAQTQGKEKKMGVSGKDLFLTVEMRAYSSRSRDVDSMAVVFCGVNSPENNLIA